MVEPGGLVLGGSVPGAAVAPEPVGARVPGAAVAPEDPPLPPAPPRLGLIMGSAEPEIGGVPGVGPGPVPGAPPPGLSNELEEADQPTSTLARPRVTRPSLLPVPSILLPWPTLLQSRSRRDSAWTTAPGQDGARRDRDSRALRFAAASDQAVLARVTCALGRGRAMGRGASINARRRTRFRANDRSLSGPEGVSRIPGKRAKRASLTSLQKGSNPRYPRHVGL
jgi:hypothetical protein